MAPHRRCASGCRCSRTAGTARDEASDPLAAVNRRAAAHDPLEQAGRRLKQRNRQVYYALKCGVLFAPVALILVVL